MRYPGFIGPSARSRSKIACADRTVNLYPEKNDSGTAASPWTLYRTPGYFEYCDLGTSSPVRGQYSLNGDGFTVAGDTLYRLPSAIGGTATTLATGLQNPDDGPVSIAGSGDGSFQLAIAAGSELYCFDLQTNTLTTIPDIAATTVVFFNATFYALDANSSSIFASDPEDASSWDVLVVAQRTTAPDKILQMARVGTEIWMMGSQTSSPYYDADSDEFPLLPNPSVFIQRGIAAPASLCVNDTTAIWLGQGVDGGGSVYMAQGYLPRAISTNAVEYAIAQYDAIGDAEGMLYQEEGHQFYVLRFPSANATWVYDISENAWHERGEFNGLDYDALPVRSQIYLNGLNLVGSTTTGKVYVQSLDYATETDGTTAIRWLRRAPHLSDELVRITYPHFRLHAEVGVGLPSGNGSDPQVGLRYSDDGGQSFGNVDYASLGPMGAYGTLVDWRLLGQGRDRVFEVFSAAPVITALVDAYLKIRPGMS